MNEKNNLLSQDVKIEEKIEEEEEGVEQDWVDIDAEHMKDLFQCGLYSAHIFQYYKDREVYLKEIENFGINTGDENTIEVNFQNLDIFVILDSV